MIDVSLMSKLNICLVKTKSGKAKGCNKGLFPYV